MTRLKTALAFAATAAAFIVGTYLAFDSTARADGGLGGEAQLDNELAQVLRHAGFTGRIEDRLEDRLGRELDQDRANLGRLLFFDKILGLNNDNACAGCHSPTNGFGDTQSIAIGIENNNIVGPDRRGPRNQRRTPMVLNTAFFPNLMWNSRFASVSDDPFDNADGFIFPPPEAKTLSYLPHLLTAQAFIPPTERNEAAGFVFPGTSSDIRDEVVRRLNQSPNYRRLFRQVFRDLRPNDPIIYDHLAAAIAEFEFTLTFARAPIDLFARGDRQAMTASEKRGAILFFGEAGCVACHAVAGDANEMFSDFTMHVIGVPQIMPRVTNSVFDGPQQNEDFGLEQVSGRAADRYRFRTSPLRNAALNAAFFHNGAFTTLEEAIRHHLDVRESALNYTPVGRLDADLTGATGPIQPVLQRLDSRLRRPIRLTAGQFNDLVAFVRTGLLDPRALPARLNTLIPPKLPSGMDPLEFQTGGN